MQVGHYYVLTNIQSVTKMLNNTLGCCMHMNTNIYTNLFSFQYKHQLYENTKKN